MEKEERRNIFVCYVIYDVVIMVSFKVIWGFILGKSYFNVFLMVVIDDLFVMRNWCVINVFILVFVFISVIYVIRCLDEKII